MRAGPGHVALAFPALLALLAPGPAVAQEHGHVHEPVAPRPDAYTESKRIDDLARQYVAEFARWAPSTATALGIHDADTLLEDRSRQTIEAWEKELGAFQTALEPEIERGVDSAHVIDRRVFRHLVAEELFALTEIRAWERNPMYYNGILSGSVYELAVKRFAPAEERLRCVVARERQFPRLVAQAKENLADPPEVFTRKAIDLTRGTIEFLKDELPALAAEVSDTALVALFREENARAIQAVEEYVAFLETDLLPRSTGSFALGDSLFARLVRIDSGFDVPTAHLLRTAERALDATLDEFKRTAKKVPGKGGAAEKALALGAAHPPADSLVAAVAGVLDSLRRFVVEREIVTLPEGGPPLVTPMPAFAWGFAAMNSPGPFETVATDAYDYVKTPEPGWTPEKTEEHLRFFGPWDLAVVSIHEVYPGHFVQSLATRAVESPIRRLAGDAASVEGWAHYAEQMMLDEGFGAEDPRYRLAQLRMSLLRLCRLVAAIRMHTAGMTVDEAARLFEKKAFLAPFPARREAERGAFDPGYGCYALGKMSILKLREDWKERAGAAYSLRDFHDRFLGYGPIPIPIVRSAMLGPLAGPLL